MAGPWPCIFLKTAPASSFPWRSWSLQSLLMAASSHYPATLGCGKTSLLPNLHSQFQKWGFNKDPHTHTPTIENSILPTNWELNDKLLKWHIHFPPTETFVESTHQFLSPSTTSLTVPPHYLRLSGASASNTNITIQLFSRWSPWAA